MGAFYGIKVLTGETNEDTGKAWVIKDVPKLWQKATKAYISEHQEG